MRLVTLLEKEDGNPIAIDAGEVVMVRPLKNDTGCVLCFSQESKLANIFVQNGLSEVVKIINRACYGFAQTGDQEE